MRHMLIPPFPTLSHVAPLRWKQYRSHAESSHRAALRLGLDSAAVEKRHYNLDQLKLQEHFRFCADNFKHTRKCQGIWDTPVRLGLCTLANKQ